MGQPRLVSKKKNDQINKSITFERNKGHNFKIANYTIKEEHKRKPRVTDEKFQGFDGTVDNSEDNEFTTHGQEWAVYQIIQENVQTALPTWNAYNSRISTVQ